MFGQKQPVPSQPALLVPEGRQIEHLNQEAYAWLGERYVWYNKIRNAKKGGFQLLQDRSLEEQMEATRSALTLVGRTLNTGLMLAYNSVVDGVKNSGTDPEGWPNKIEGADRSEPPTLNEQQDALIIAWMPLKFLNLAKPVRDKGKGLDFYVDGLVKKFCFKVVGYYTDPDNWAPERLGYFLSGLTAESSLQEVQGKLAGLKSEVDMFTATHQMFRFGRARGRPDPTKRNTLEETFEISDKDLVKDLYFQSMLVSGMEHFLFRYYLTLLSATQNVRALKQISQIFLPLLAKAEEVHLRFQASFAMERDKSRLRQEYMAYFKEMEAKPPEEVLQEKGKEVRRVNYTHRRLENAAFPRSGQFSAAQIESWSEFLRREVLEQLENGRGHSLLIELLNTLMRGAQTSMDGKLKVAQAIREFADDQERLGRAQVNQKKKAIADAKRAKARELAKFRVQEQKNMVEVLQQEMTQLETAGQQEIEQLEQAIAKRREAQIARVEQLEAVARQDRDKNMGKTAAVVYVLAARADTERKLRASVVSFLVRMIQEDKDDHYDLLYRNLFGVFGGLFPTEKMVLRTAVSQKLELGENELAISEEELDSYKQQVLARKTELNMEVPGLLEYKLTQGPVAVKVDDLLSMGLTSASLRLLFQLPFAGVNKAAGKIPLPAVKKLLLINQLSHPMPENDLVLTNVEETAPPLKRINFNRLQKLMP